MNDSNVSNLISRARDGDETAKAELLGHFRHYLRLLAHLHLRQLLQAKFDESDIVQETCMQAAQAFHQFQGNSEKQLAAWLRQILANKGAAMARNYLADKRDVQVEIRLQHGFDKSSMDLARVIPDRNASPSQAAVRRERSVQLADAIAKVSGDKREVLILHGLQGSSVADVAKSMGRSEASTWKLWARGLQELRQFTTEMK
jgi:RNA polymerase sigma-70 factor (ECF subfamily)